MMKRKKKIIIRLFDCHTVYWSDISDNRLVELSDISPINALLIIEPRSSYNARTLCLAANMGVIRFSFNISAKNVELG